MFGFGSKKTHDVRLTDKEIKELEKKMSRSELKKFRARQKQAQSDREWDCLIDAEFFGED